MVVVGPYLRDRAEVLAEALSERRGSPVEVRVAERGDKRRLRELAERNARSPSTRTGCAASTAGSAGSSRSPRCSEALGMEELPVRIEGFDISNLGGEHTVASMVVFEGGATKKSDYRRFRIRGEARAGGGNGGPDDFASMEEVLERRMARYLEQADLSPHDGKRDESFASLPSLIVIDGGKGQLSAGMRALRAVRRARRDRGQPRQADRGGLRPRPLGAARPARRLGGARSCCSGSATRPTASRSTTTAAAATRR